MLDGNTTSLNRRQRLRARTVEEIVEQAMTILDDEGAHAVTLAAIAKAMGMSAPGLYRYFASRDALLERLLRLVHEQLAATLEEQAAAGSGFSPDKRLRVLAAAYRGWALRYPKRHQMIFSDPTARSGPHDEATDFAAAAAAADRGMGVLIAVLSELHGAAAVQDRPSGPLDVQLRHWWTGRTGEAISADALRLAVLTWTRLHGIVSLELTGAFAAIGVDPALLIDSELATLTMRWPDNAEPSSDDSTAPGRPSRAGPVVHATPSPIDQP
jgi:AcrR family transcriptional regulator